MPSLGSSTKHEGNKSYNLHKLLQKTEEKGMHPNPSEVNTPPPKMLQENCRQYPPWAEMQKF